VDGNCDDYPGLGAAVQTFSDGGGAIGKIYFIYTDTQLFVCMKGAQGTLQTRFGRLYIDPQADGSGYVYANQADLGFQVNIPGTTRSSYRGKGSPNGWTIDATLDGSWQGAATVGAATAPTGDSVEYALSLKDLNFGASCSLFGMAVYHHWFANVGDDYGWPSNHWFDQPRTWQIAQLGGPRCEPARGRIAYVFRGNTLDASSFFNLLTSHYTVDLIPLSSVLTTDFSVYQLILVADDTGSLDQWGLTSFTTAQVAKITLPNIPIIGIGEGGYAFFGRLSLFIGWPRGWHGPQKQVGRHAGAPAAFFAGIVGTPITHYSAPVNSVGIYTKPAVPSDVTLVGDEVPSDDHTQLIFQGCRLLWGASGNPLLMTADGKKMFLNAVGYMYTFQCPKPTPPPQGCYSVAKTANPPAGTPVQPGDVIEYTLKYQIISNVDCVTPPTGITLVDTIPLNTVYVPGSASGGIAPGGDGSLVWPVSSSSAPLSKTFKVVVSETQCRDQRMVNNRAGLLIPSYLPLPSNVVSHPVTCSPVGFPNNNPSYAQDEIQINPYPLILGHPSSISVRISNFTGTNTPVTVEFQTSPNKFGIGLNFNTFDTRATVVPANGQVIVVGSFTPASSGHYCIQVVVHIAGQAKPLVTQQNLDVNENLHAGVPDTLSFKVGNPTSITANISLVVDNTCPGWIATIIPPALLTNVGPNDSDIRTAQLQVTPPNPLVLNGGCHIDVQGWIGDHMIGGIRKLDVPPVHLPANVQPPWEEPETSFVPDPPVVGTPGKICVELQNPDTVAHDVTIKFEMSDFGAGVDFTEVGTQKFSLKPHTLAKYCIPWTPATGGTLHRCARVTLIQDGAQNQDSQHNVDLVRPGLGRLDLLAPKFIIGNPDLITHTLELTTTMVGIDPYWVIRILPDPPPVLGPGQHMDFMLSFVPAMQATSAPQAPPPNFRMGDVSQVEVNALLDGQSAGGFTIQLDSLHIFLPTLSRAP
jgi:uncharacterized repeat protein (TIGR01451 family)